ncbi:hypothetical protein FACS18948_4030 [Clostridia bacterium]|nr:hypothetical protein FACS18948_4030 [Clostridia bacterium]
MNELKRFWKWARDENERTLYIDGVIAAESWYGDEVSPVLFREKLFAADGDITVYLNSSGGDVIAASQIYTMLLEYPRNVLIKIDGLAASAASVIAMAGTTVLMAAPAMMMIHEPMTIAIGDSEEMRKAINMLDEVKEGIISAYALKTGMSRAKLARLMAQETWMNARKAIEWGFADGILDDPKHRQPDDTAYSFSRRAVTNSLLDKLRPKAAHTEPLPAVPDAPPLNPGTPVESLDKRLSLISH